MITNNTLTTKIPPQVATPKGEKKRSFSSGIGRWIGSAEVYSGEGQFLGNAHDYRNVHRPSDKTLLQIDTSFIGPFKYSGSFTIAEQGDYRLYQGPDNYGYAETLSENLIDANSYWPITGLNERFFLMILPGCKRQIGLSLLTRGEHLIYVVIGDYQKVNENWHGIHPYLLNGTSFDLADDQSAGRGTNLMHRPGCWQGHLRMLDADLAEVTGTTMYSENIVSTESQIRSTIIGNAFDSDPRQLNFTSKNNLAWSSIGQVVGSYSLSGGRAMSGTFYHLAKNIRVWRREVISHDGSYKAVVHVWYRGSQRAGMQFGVLQFTPQNKAMMKI